MTVGGGGNLKFCFKKRKGNFFLIRKKLKQQHTFVFFLAAKL